MRHVPRLLWPGLVLGLALALAGCVSESHPWVEPQDHKVTIASDGMFLRTRQGDYVDGYLATYESEFERQRMFMVLEILPYLKGDRLIITGRFNGDNVLLPLVGSDPERVPVFVVERAAPNIPAAPNVPSLK